MEDYNTILDSLEIRFVQSQKVNVIHGLHMTRFHSSENTIFLLHKGSLKVGLKQKSLPEGDILFIPAGRYVNITFGEPERGETLSQAEFNNYYDKYFSDWNPDDEQTNTYFTQITFDTRIFSSVSFFRTLALPAYFIKDHFALTSLINKIITEGNIAKTGSRRIINAHCVEITVEILRYTLEKKLFVEKMATNSTYFKDPRLIRVFNYIQENIKGDLSNKILAYIADVSEDYVGQYFKMLTGINPQDYIEYQRMEEAVILLRNSNKSIRAIGAEVGYKDTAYFCRRFKMMFGIPAGKMRKRSSGVVEPEEDPDFFDDDPS